MDPRNHVGKPYETLEQKKSETSALLERTKQPLGRHLERVHPGRIKSYQRQRAAAFHQV